MFTLTNNVIIPDNLKIYFKEEIIDLHLGEGTKY